MTRRRFVQSGLGGLAAVVADVRRVVPEDGIVLVDVGAHHNWMVAEYEVWKPRTLLQTWGYASNRPTVLDVRVDPDVRPLATGSWDLPPLPPPNPNFGWEED